MADGKQEIVSQNSGQKIQLKMKELEIVLKKLGQDPVGELKIKLKELEAGYRGWLEKQSLPVETAVVSTISAAQGAAIGSFMGVLSGDTSANLNPPPNLNPQATSSLQASLQQAQALSGGPTVQARNFAVMTGVNAGITCVMKRIRGKEDIQTNMVAAFGSGAMFSVVSGLGGPNQAANAITSGLFFALIQGGIFKLQEKFKQPPGKDVETQMYDKTKNLLTSLGLERYEKNFKKGLLTDTTLPLLNDSALQDVRIPPGPRLLILDRIKRDPELKERRG